MAERRDLVFTDPWQKAKWLDGAARIDALHPRIRAIGAELLQQHGDTLDRAAAAHAIASALLYRPDPGGFEEFGDAPEVLRSGEDDCDGLARLFVALCLAARIEARIRPVFARVAQFTHVQAEALIAGVWWLSDPSVAAPFGRGAEAGRRFAQ